MIGRNELCPCGSGKKYKKCCLAKDEAKEIAKNRILYATNQYQNVFKNIEEFSKQDKYNDSRIQCQKDFNLEDYNLINTYYLCDYEYDEQSSIMMDYFNSKKQSLNDSESSIIENIRKSYVSIYQIKEKDINKIMLRDILLEENIYVEDINLFEAFALGDYVLARIVAVSNTKILLDETLKLEKQQMNNIKQDINKRYKNAKKKYKNKREFMLDNLRIMYENIISINKSKLKEHIKENEDLVKEDKVDENEHKIIILEKDSLDAKEEVCLTNDSEIKKDRKICEARLANNSSVKKVNKRLEAKLNERLEKTRRLNSLKQTEVGQVETEIISKIDSMPVSKKESINSKIDNNIVAKLDDKKTVKKIKKSHKKRISKEKVVDNSNENNGNKYELSDCGVYNLLMSKVELKYREKCVNLWKRFLEKYENYTGNEGGWVSALEYYVRKEANDNITQEQISKKYGVSPKTLGKRYKELQGNKTLSNL